MVNNENQRDENQDKLSRLIQLKHDTCVFLTLCFSIRSIVNMVRGDELISSGLDSDTIDSIIFESVKETLTKNQEG